MAISAQNSPTGVDSSPQQSGWSFFKKRFGKSIGDVLRFSPVKNGLTQMADCGRQWLSSRRMKYMPMTALLLLLFSASQADAQCCGAQANMQVGLKVGNTTNYTDFLSENNGRTNDGLTREGYFNFHQSVFMTEFVLGYGRLGQVQDAANNYKGDFTHAAASIMLAGSSDRIFIPYAGIRGGYMHSQVEGRYGGVPYEYSGGRFFWGPVVGANFNIGEVVAVGIRAQSTYFLNDADDFEGISGGKEDDSQGKGIYPGAYGLRIGILLE